MIGLGGGHSFLCNYEQKEKQVHINYNGNFDCFALKAEQMKKSRNQLPSLNLTENPDILATLANRTGNKRPSLVVGFAAETENVIENAVKKRDAKGCDWILANDVSPSFGTFGGDENSLHLAHGQGVESWERMTKADAACRLARRVSDFFEAA